MKNMNLLYLLNNVGMCKGGGLPPLNIGKEDYWMIEKKRLEKKNGIGFKYSFKRNKEIYFMLIPIILYYAIFKYGPMFGNVIAFQDYRITRGFLESDFVGLKHFKSFLNDVYFKRILRNTLSINFAGLIFGFPMPIIFALLLNEVRNLKFKKAVQTITYMPHFISTVVMSSLIISFVSPSGLINSIITGLGFEKIAFLTQSKYFVGVYTISGIWQNLGWSSIIYISALSAIDTELYEAAAVDGASRWKQTIHITIPGIMPTICIMLIMRIGSMMSVGYEKIMLLYNPTIYETADVISTYVYRKGIEGAQYSYSAAVGMFNNIVNFILLMSANWFSKKVQGIGLF